MFFRVEGYLGFVLQRLKVSSLGFAFSVLAPLVLRTMLPVLKSG